MWPKTSEVSKASEVWLVFIFFLLAALIPQPFLGNLCKGLAIQVEFTTIEA